MNHGKIIILHLLLACIAAGRAEAQRWSFADMRKDSGKFFLGFLSGIAAHEMGHIIAAKSKGYSVSLEGAVIVYPGAKMSRSDALEVSSAGFQAQWIASEMSFLHHSLKKHPEKMGNFSAGIIVSHMAISAAYLAVLKNHPDGDIRSISAATDYSRDIVALSVVLPALLDAWRLFGEDVPAWAPTASVMSKGLMIGCSWRF